MPDPIRVLLSHLEREYYDGVSTQKLQERVQAIVEEILRLDTNNTPRRLIERNASELWGAEGPSPLTRNAVDTALNGPNGAGHLRAWANLWKVIATYRDVA